jgi:hypothetical protein
VNAEWVVGALAIAAGSFVMGLTGFGIALVSLDVLPYVMAPQTAIVLLTVYALAFAAAMLVPLRREVGPGTLRDLVIGTVAGTPPGVWVLASLPAAALNRLIGAMLVAVVLLELRGRLPPLAGPGWPWRRASWPARSAPPSARRARP